MAKAIRRLKNIEVDEISLVDDGDNPGAQMVLFKARHDPEEDEERRRQRLKPKVTKRTFDEVRVASQLEFVHDILMNRIGDLRQAISESLFKFRDEDDDRDAEATIKRSLGQFAESMSGDLGEIFAGRLLKALDCADPTPEAIEKALIAAFDHSTTPADAADTTEGGHMDLSKLTKKDREAVEAAIAKAGGVADLETTIETQKAEIAKLTPADDDDDPLKGVDESVRKVMEPLLKAQADEQTRVAKENTDLKTRLAKIEETAARNIFEKSVGDLDGLPTPRAELIESLYKITDVESRAAMLKTLEAAAAAARMGVLTGGIGSELTEGGTAYAKIEALAEELRKTEPTLTAEIAKTRVMNAHPELYDAVLAESQ